jgi:hypothetical protein
MTLRNWGRCDTCGTAFQWDEAYTYSHFYNLIKLE